MGSKITTSYEINRLCKWLSSLKDQAQDSDMVNNIDDTINCIRYLENHRNELLPFVSALSMLVSSSKNLRNSQIMYLSDRENELKGMVVGQFAFNLDHDIKHAEDIINKFNLNLNIERGHNI